MLARLGLYPDVPRTPIVVGYEVAGRIDALGHSVVGLAEGDRVVALTRFGGYADTVVVPAAQVFRFPDSLSDAAFRAWKRTPSFSPMSLINRNVGVFGLHVGHLWNEGRALASLMTMLMNEMAAGRVAPVVARTFPLEQAAEAHRFIQTRQNIGKVVLTT